MTDNVFFQVNEVGVTYVTADRRILKSQSRPPMSFDYEILTYSADEKTVYLNYSKRDLTEKEIEEVETYILSIQENKEASLMMAQNRNRDLSASLATAQSDLKVRENRVAELEAILKAKDSLEHQFALK